MTTRLAKVRQGAIRTPLSAFLGGNLHALLRVLGCEPIAATEEDVETIENALKRYEEIESVRPNASQRHKALDKLE